MAVGTRQIALGLVALTLLGGGCGKKSPTQAHFRLTNGLRVDLYATSRGEKAALALLFDVGADRDPPGRSGTAHLVEHLLATSGRAGKPARTIDEVKAQFGHGFHALTGADYTLYAMEVSAGRLTEEMDDAALRMSRLTPLESDLNRERKRLLDELASSQGRDAASAAMFRAAEAIRPSRGGGARGGVPAEIEAMTLDDVEAFRLDHYGATSARLIVAGRFDLDEVSRHIKATFDSVPAGKPAKPRAPAGASVTGTLVMGDAPSAMALAVPAPDLKDPLYPAFLVLAARVVGAGAPPRSWKGDFAPLERPDVLFVTSGIPAGQQPEPAAAAMRAEVAAIVKAPLGADELDQTLAKFGETVGITPMRADTCAAEPFEVAFAAGRRAQLGIDGATLAGTAHALTADQVSAAAQLFDNAHSAAVIAGGKIH